MSIDPRLLEYSNKIKSFDASWRQKTEEFLAKLAITDASLGELSELAIKLVSVSKKLTPTVTSKCVVIMAGDHGISSEKVSKYPLVTSSLVKTILDGSAAVSILAKENNCDLKVVDMGIVNALKEFVKNDNFFSKYVSTAGTRNFSKVSAMSDEECLKALLTGIEIAEGFSHRYDIFGVGDIGGGNTTSAAAIASALLDIEPLQLAGVARAQDEAHLAHKSKVIQEALAFHNLNSEQGFLEILTKVGGFEIASLVGFIIGATARNKLVVLDGFTSSVAALCAQQLCPDVTNYLIASHLSGESGHTIILDKLGLKPLLRLNMRVGQGVGVPMAFSLIENTSALLRYLSHADEISG
ncbi:MAG: nicotinate-nucleotide--dimethylbenzimidazole phosphoribosyltransferase [Lentisphaerales bacterium]|nr:nicotinate-nucleotide--dimethylbenzimidazole phosphoribosyltransferase [Lentisphaerales bacterium]